MSQPNLAKGSHQVNFIHQAGQWWARVNEHLPIGFTRRIDLPVYCEPRLCVAQLDHHNPTWHKHHIHVCFPEKAPDQRGYVYVGSMGLKGGATLQVDIEGIMATLRTLYGLIQPGQPPDELVAECQAFLHELASIIASTDVDLATSPMQLDPGNMRTRIEAILERSTQRRMHLGNYGVAYHHILEQVRAQIRQRQTLPIQASAYPKDSYAITLSLRIGNIFALLLALNSVASAAVGETPTFDLSNFLDMIGVVVDCNDRFYTFEQEQQQRQAAQRQREEQQQRQAAQRQREEESLQEKLANLALDQGEEEEFHLAELEQPNNQPASSSAQNTNEPISVVELAQIEIGEAGMQLIKEYESCTKDAQGKHIPYTSPAGKPTIGYGPLVLPGEDFKQGLTDAQAEELLKQDIQRVAIKPLKGLINKGSLTQNQYDAVVALVFNTAPGKKKDTGDTSPRKDFANSKTLKLIQHFAKNKASMTQEQLVQFEVDLRREWAEFRTGGGKVLPGLVKRRQAELDLFFGHPAP